MFQTTISIRSNRIESILARMRLGTRSSSRWRYRIKYKIKQLLLGRMGITLGMDIAISNNNNTKPSNSHLMKNWIENASLASSRNRTKIFLLLKSLSFMWRIEHGIHGWKEICNIFFVCFTAQRIILIISISHFTSIWDSILQCVLTHCSYSFSEIELLHYSLFHKLYR